MNDSLRDTLVRKLEHLPDETARQLLDYIEFLESKYHRSVRDRSTLERLADNIEGTLGATRLSQAAVRGTAQVIETAGSVMRGVVAAGQAVVDELQNAASTDTPTDQAPDPTGETSPPETDTKSPEGDEERLTKE